MYGISIELNEGIDNSLVGETDHIIADKLSAIGYQRVKSLTYVAPKPTCTNMAVIHKTILSLGKIKGLEEHIDRVIAFRISECDDITECVMNELRS